MKETVSVKVTLDRASVRQSLRPLQLELERFGKLFPELVDLLLRDAQLLIELHAVDRKRLRATRATNIHFAAQPTDLSRALLLAVRAFNGDLRRIEKLSHRRASSVAVGKVGTAKRRTGGRRLQSREPTRSVRVGIEAKDVMRMLDTDAYARAFARKWKR